MKTLKKKPFVMLLLLIAVLLLATLWAVVSGSGSLNVWNVLQTFFGAGTDTQARIVFNFRLPRIVTAALVGAALAVSGAILQGVVRNALASPDIIGMTGGASVFAVFFITYLSDTLSHHWLPVFSMTGAAVFSVIMYVLAWNKGVSSIRLVLIGVGLASLAGSLTTFMIVLSPIFSTTEAYIWLTGSVYGSGWGDVLLLLPWVVIFSILAWLMSGIINVHEFGDEVAAGLGSAIQRHRMMLIGISIALAGAAVSVAGAVGFVGLIGPHVARMLVGRSYTRLIPASALTGAVLVVAADTIARTAFAPLDIPAGVFTSGIGAPFFLYLLFRTRND